MIAAGKERFEGLQIARQWSLASVRGNGPDLSTRQMAMLLTVYLTPPPHTVRALADILGVAKPVISRALDTVCRLGYLRRKRDPTDRRNVLIQRTIKGAVFLDELNDRMVTALHAPKPSPKERSDVG